MDLIVLFQDDAILVIDKPAGISVLQDGWSKNTQYLYGMVASQFGKVFLVHRIDKLTSGLVIFARSQEAQRSLGIQFENHEIEKTYLAILSGRTPWEEKTINFPLRANVGHSHRTVVDTLRGKPSETIFHVLQKFPNNTYVEVFPKTGRMHQIRAHALALGFPLLGDTLYRSEKTEIISRPALHAKSLSFFHPISREKMTMQASQPQDFLKVLEKLNQ